MGSTLTGVEIFRTGKWNGDLYTEADLDSMVAAFDRVGFSPPLKLGHDKTPGARAWGWVANLRRVGNKLVADFKDVPAALMQVIKERGLDTVSSEVFWNFQRGGQLYRRVLKAVALLGAEIPAVSGLAPLRTVLNTLGVDVMYEEIRSYQFTFQADGDGADDPSLLLDREVRRLAMLIREPGFSRPYPDSSRALRVWGTANAESQMRDLQITAAEACAVAVKGATTRFPEAFGTIDSFADHQTKVAKARTKLSSTYDKMRAAVSGADLIIDTDSLLPNDKARGLARVAFKCAPDIVLAHPDWPRLLAEHQLAKTGGGQKKKAA